MALRCPECGSEPRFTAAPVQPFPDGLFGVLTCPCSTYPVLDSIPVMRRGHVDVQAHGTGRVEVAGPDVDTLVDLVRAGRGLDALVEMLAFPPPVPFGLGARRGLRLPFTRGPWPRLAREARRAEVAAMLAALDDLTAQDWMELCYQRSSDRLNNDVFLYFLARFGQPRFLATMSFLRALPDDARSVLDLACGFGHTLHHLAARERSARAVGVDRNFFQIWVGRRYVAPTQWFVCADRVDALPFHDDAFSVSVCTDAFHLFGPHQKPMDELRRVAQRDTVLIDRVGNGNLEPYDVDDELSPQGYVELLCGAPHRMLPENEFVACYLAGRGVGLAAPRDVAGLAESKWLALITSTDESLFVDDGDFGTPPHAAGVLQVNPIFSVERDRGEVHLEFRFPSVWYAYENAVMATYTSAGERMDEATFDALAEGRPTERTSTYLRRFVVMGMPSRYARRPGTPPRHTSVGAGLLEGARRRWGRGRR